MVSTTPGRTSAPAPPRRRAAAAAASRQPPAAAETPARGRRLERRRLLAASAWTGGSASMCGIGLYCVAGGAGGSESLARPARALRAALERRGPDAFGEIEDPVGADEGGVLRMMGATLHIQGRRAQPAVDGRGNALLWNGEVYRDGDGAALGAGEGDTDLILELLGSCESAEDAVAQLARLRAEFAFVYWRRAAGEVWFARDCVGRRSLLFAAQGAEGDECAGDEGAGALHGLRCTGFALGSALPPGAVPEAFGPVAQVPLGAHVLRIGGAGLRVRTLPWPGNTATCCALDALPAWSLADAAASEAEARAAAVERALVGAVEARIARGTLPEREHGGDAGLAILYSGGLDCSLIAAIAGSLWSRDRGPIDLLSACFDKPAFRSPDRVAALDGVEELRRLFPAVEWRLVLVDVDYADAVEGACRDRLNAVLPPHDSTMDFNIGAALWFASRGRGTLHGAASSRKRPRAGASEGVGGSSDGGGTGGGARGEGGRGAPYATAARVVLAGQGADELAGGYTRHYAAFRRGGWEALAAELSRDAARIPARNLSRDDRVVCDHGRELRLPFVDPEVIRSLRALPLAEVCNPELPRGVGDKLVLRRIARRRGIARSAALPKRAVQFGTRIAKHSTARTGASKGNAAALRFAG